MRTALAAMLLSASLRAADVSDFLLPDAMDDALEHLVVQIDTAHRQIILATPSLKTHTLTKALERAVERGVALTLITSGSDDDANALVRFENVDFRVIDGLRSDTYSGSLSVSLLSVDASLACSISMPLSQDELSHSIGLVECSRQASLLRRYAAYLATMRERSRGYLRP